MKGTAMKSIATINFKGGVGKTTITWLLAKYVAEVKKKKVLVVDTDAQMSLTLSIQLQETGSMIGEFENWYENHHLKKDKTILSALEKYDSLSGGHFDFPINSSFIYPMSDNLFFVPSVVDLYWLELEVFDKEKVKHFIRALLGKMEHSKKYDFDYVFFDCPPNFTALSYSVLSCSSLILIPVNPDVFASRGIGLMVDGLRFRIEPWPNPDIAIFMNKAKERVGKITIETQRFWNEAKYSCEQIREEGIPIKSWDSFIPDRVNIKRAIPGRYFPDEFESYFSELWINVENSLRKKQ
ncbi:MAG: AAA family ATPase [Candidatus Lokiarchaeota archaeon]|nr:AAA family ATPase [Candidatus Lokiarchaeota archaeon]